MVFHLNPVAAEYAESVCNMQIVSDPTYWYTRRVDWAVTAYSSIPDVWIQV